MTDLRNTKIRILSPEHSKAFFDYAKSLGAPSPKNIELLELGYPFGFYIYKGCFCDGVAYNFSVFGDEIFDVVHTEAREITFNSKTREIEFVGGSQDGFSLERRMQLCPECGNKRCNKAENPKYKCTNSNAVTQPEPVLEASEPMGGGSTTKSAQLDSGDVWINLSQLGVGETIMTYDKHGCTKTIVITVTNKPPK